MWHDRNERSSVITCQSEENALHSWLRTNPRLDDVFVARPGEGVLVEKKSPQATSGSTRTHKHL